MKYMTEQRDNSINIDVIVCVDGAISTPAF